MNSTPLNLPLGGLILTLLAAFSNPPGLFAQEQPSLTDRTTATVQDAKTAVQDASRSAAKTLEALWQGLDESRLKNRTGDEIVAWVIMGILAGAVAGMMTSLKTTSFGKLGRLLLGLAGAFIGGIVVRIAQFDFGWGPVLIRYEELFFSLLGAILLLFVFRLLRSRLKKRPAQP